MPKRSWEITDLIDRWDAGDEAALDEIFEKLFDELRRIAHNIFKRGGRRRGHTLQPTALVNEAFIRIKKANRGRIPSSAAFHAYVAKTIAHILAEHDLRKRRKKHGGYLVRVPLGLADEPPEEFVELSAVEAFDLLERLDGFEPKAARVQYYRTYLGLTIPEAANVLGVSDSTVTRGLKTALAWMKAELAPAG